MYLVVSVEYLGLHPAVRRAVGSLSHAPQASGAEDGARRVTSALLLANGPDLEPAVRASWGWEDVGLGVELNLACGRPLADPDSIPSLVEEDGAFPGSPGSVFRRGLARKIKTEEVRREWTLQLERLRDLGVRPTHLSSLGQVHALPRLMNLARELAQRFEITWVNRPLEPVSPFRFDGPAWRCRFLSLLALGSKARRGAASPTRVWGLADQGLSFAYPRLAKALAGLQANAVLEVLCRPGLLEPEDAPVDPAFACLGLDRLWTIELEALRQPGWDELLTGPEIKLRHFGQLRPKAAAS